MGGGAGAQLLTQLAGRAVACLPEFAPQHVSVLLWAYAKLDTSPGMGLLSGAAAAALAAMPRFNPQNMANTLWAYATLGHYPGAALLDAAGEQLLATLPDFNPQVGPQPVLRAFAPVSGTSQGSSAEDQHGSCCWAVKWIVLQHVAADQSMLQVMKL